MAKLQGVKTINMQDGIITKVSYQGEEYTKVDDFDGTTEIGNLIRCTYTFASHFTEGAYYEVIKSGGNPVRDNDGRNPRLNDSKFEVFRKSPAAVSSAPFAEMITDKVSAVEDRVSALEDAKETAKPTPTFNEGDRVKALSDGEYSIAEAGEYGVIGSFDCGMPGDPFTIEFKRDLNGQYDYFRPQDLELVPKEEPKPVVGDIVVITGNTMRSDNAVGDIGKVTEVDPDSSRVEVVGGSDWCNWIKNDEMRNATPVEVERYHEAVKQAEAGAVFKKAGRKPNEYRKGDVVRVTDGHRDIKTGDIGEIFAPSGSSPLVEVRDSRYYCFVEIVCFAEDRKDAVTKGGR